MIPLVPTMLAEFLIVLTGTLPWHGSTPAAGRAPAGLPGIATGYRGHFACRTFSGMQRDLAIAVSDGEPGKVRELLSAGADINARSDGSHTRGMTMLQVAVWHRWGEGPVRLLIESGANVSARDALGNTALILACESSLVSDLPMIELLIRAGADVNARGSGGMTPLMHAALNGETKHVAQRLMDASANALARDKRGWTALMHATRRRKEHLEMVQLLAAAGSPVNATHDRGGTALSIAAYHGHTQVVRYLIDAGANVNAADEAKWTALICSSMNGYAPIVQMLIESGANVNSRDRLGRTALTLAEINHHAAICQLLVLGGAK